MIGFFKLTALFFVSSVVVAQSSTSGSAAAPTSTAGLDPCITTCSQQAATGSGCVSFTNVTCVCSSQQFQAAALACLQKNCTSSEVQIAQGIQSAVCGGASASGSGSGSSLGPTATGPGPISLSSTAPISGSSGTPSASEVPSSSGSSSGSASGSASGTASSGASVGKYAYVGIFGKELGALAMAGAGAILGGALLL